MQEGPKQIHRPRPQMPADPLGPRLDPNRQSRHKRQPIAVKEKTGAPVGLLVTLAFGGLFCAYAFNANGAKDALDAWFEGLANSAHSHDAAVGMGFVTALPFIGMALGLAVIYVIFKLMMGGKKKKKPTVLLETMTVHEFAELMAGRGVGARVAREGYRMLMPDYGEKLRSTIDKSFAELDVSRETIVGMFEELAERSEGALPGRMPVLTTVMEMLIAVEGTVERAALERRRGMQGVTVEHTHRLVVPLPGQPR